MMASNLVVEDIPQPPQEVGYLKTEQENDEKVEDTVVFSSYKCRSLQAGIQHPGNIMEGASLAAMMLPTAAYPLFEILPKSIVEEGKLSNLQLESVMYVCQRHQKLLPFRFGLDGQPNTVANTKQQQLPGIKKSCTRAGFFIGDGPGVGKGRQIAGIIIANLGRGRTKHVWFSTSLDLRIDAERDLRDLGCHIKVINGAQELDKETRVMGLSQEYKEGVLFCTYHTLTRPSRFRQLVEWCGSDYEGCIFFDESHKAKNSTVGDKTGSKISEAATTLQRLLPLSRVVYCSATGATDVKNLGFMERLGLWGPGLSFPTFDTFLEDIGRRGLGALEMMAMEMKISGVYVSRSLSFQDCEFEILQTTLNLEEACLEVSITRGVGTGRAMSVYWGANQRKDFMGGLGVKNNLAMFFMQLCIALKIRRVVQEAKEALENGCCVVIGLQTTGEASLESELGKRSTAALTSFVSITKEILTRYLRTSFPTTVQATAGDAPYQDAQAAHQQSLLLKAVSDLDLPPTSLDAIIDAMGGTSKVAEMTGRHGRMVRVGTTNEIRYESRGEGEDDLDNLNIYEKERFMRGDKLVAVISEAASTGISLHAAKYAANGRRRVHITIELPWSADRAIQQLGRTHRSHQISAPLYKLVVCDLPGERRCAVAVASRLQSLGALTRGDRKAASGFDLSLFNIDTKYGHIALNALYSSVLMRQLHPGIPIELVANLLQAYGSPGAAQTIDTFLETLQGAVNYTGLAENLSSAKPNNGGVKKFLNRILGMPINLQYMLYGYFTAILNQIVSSARMDGSYNEGVMDLAGENIVMIGQHVLYQDPASSVITTLHALDVDRGISFESALNTLRALTNPDDGFYIAKKAFFGKFQVILAIKRGAQSFSYRALRPATGKSGEDLSKESLASRYNKVSPEDAKEIWTQQYESALVQCSHGPSCKNGRNCTIGLRKSTVYIVSGGVVPLWGVIESTLASVAGRLGEMHRSMKVVRVETTKGERLVGVQLPYMALMALNQYLTTLAVVNASNNYRQLEEREAEFLPTALAKAMKPPTTMLTFFQRKQSPSTKEIKGSPTTITSGTDIKDSITTPKDEPELAPSPFFRASQQKITLPVTPNVSTQTQLPTNAAGVAQSRLHQQTNIKPENSWVTPPKSVTYSFNSPNNIGGGYGSSSQKKKGNTKAKTGRGVLDMMFNSAK
eukprot:Ihof_evm6s175 gene=Ihof_evmTU6s175